jgi:hypothetical protein
MLNRVNVPASPYRPDKPAPNAMSSAATDIILIPDDLGHPVFVDASGRRRRRVRLACYGFGVVCLAYAGLVGMSLAAGSVAPDGGSAFPALADGPRPSSTTRAAPSARPSHVIAPQIIEKPDVAVRTPPVPKPAPTIPKPTPTPTPSSSPTGGASPSPSVSPSSAPSPTPQPSTSPTPTPTRSAPTPTRAAVGTSSSPDEPTSGPTDGPTDGPIGQLVTRTVTAVTGLGGLVTRAP